MNKKRARTICTQIINERYPGYYLLMDRLSAQTYASLWGQDKERVEIVFARKSNKDIPVYLAEYKLTKSS